MLAWAETNPFAGQYPQDIDGRFQQKVSADDGQSRDNVPRFLVISFLDVADRTSVTANSENLKNS